MSLPGKIGSRLPESARATDRDLTEQDGEKAAISEGEEAVEIGAARKSARLWRIRPESPTSQPLESCRRRSEAVAEVDERGEDEGQSAMKRKSTTSVS